MKLKRIFQVDIVCLCMHQVKSVKSSHQHAHHTMKIEQRYIIRNVISFLLIGISQYFYGLTSKSLQTNKQTFIRFIPISFWLCGLNSHGHRERRAAIATTEWRDERKRSNKNSNKKHKENRNWTMFVRSVESK